MTSSKMKLKLYRGSHKLGFNLDVDVRRLKSNFCSSAQLRLPGLV